MQYSSLWVLLTRCPNWQKWQKCKNARAWSEVSKTTKQNANSNIAFAQSQPCANIAQQGQCIRKCLLIIVGSCILLYTTEHPVAYTWHSLAKASSAHGGKMNACGCMLPIPSWLL